MAVPRHRGPPGASAPAHPAAMPQEQRPAPLSQPEEKPHDGGGAQKALATDTKLALSLKLQHLVEVSVAIEGEKENRLEPHRHICATPPPPAH